MTCAGLAPDAARRHLDEGQQVAARVRQGGGVVAGEPLGEGRAQLAAAPWPLLGNQLTREGQDGIDVDASAGRR